MTQQYCPACGEEVVMSSGSQDCDYLIVEEFPELCLPTPAMVSKWQKEEWTPKKILSSELAKVDMVIQQFRIVSAYPHLPPANGQPLENCYNFGLEQVMGECFGKKGVIVLGGNLCKTFTGYELKQVQGLSNVPSQYLPDGDIPRVFLPTIRSIYSTGAGEFSLGLQRFVQQLGEQ